MIKTTMNPYINKFEDVDEMHYFQKNFFFFLPNYFKGKKPYLLKNKTTQLNL